MSVFDTIQIGSPLEPGRQLRLDDDPWIENLREATGNERLILYFHIAKGTHVLAVDTSFEGEETAILEVQATYGHPSISGTPFHVFAAMCAPSSNDKLAKERAAQRERRIEQHQADQEARRIFARKARAKNDYATAHLYDTGQIPISVNLHGEDELARKLKELVR